MRCDGHYDFNVHAELDAVILSRKTKALAYKLNDETFLEIRKFRLFTMYDGGEHPCRTPSHVYVGRKPSDKEFVTFSYIESESCWVAPITGDFYGIQGFITVYLNDDKLLHRIGGPAIEFSSNGMVIVSELIPQNYIFGKDIKRGESIESLISCMPKSIAKQFLFNLNWKIE